MARAGEVKQRGTPCCAPSAANQRYGPAKRAEGLVHRRGEEEARDCKMRLSSTRKTRYVVNRGPHGKPPRHSLASYSHHAHAHAHLTDVNLRQVADTQGGKSRARSACAFRCQGEGEKKKSTTRFERATLGIVLGMLAEDLRSNP